ALRHATAQATKASSAGSTARTIGLILGGAILGGQSGAELGALGAAAFQLKYSREYESQADMLGAQIMTNAGYDPHDLANVFKTIQQTENGGSPPAWLSDHPDLGKRYDAINREANYLKISSNPIKITRDFERVQARFRGMPRARSMSQIERDAQNGRNPNNPTSGGTNDPTSNGRYTDRVQIPSTRTRSYTGVSGMRMDIPSNWSDFAGQDGIEFAPDGAFGEQGITHGAMLGVYQGQNRNLGRDSQAYLDQVLQANSYLRQRGGFSQTTVGGRVAYTTVLSGRSPVTGKTEVVTVYTLQLRTGDLLYIDTVVPDDESYNYSNAFRNMLDSVQLNN
ncbi:MAG: M48 family metalloprotease, partial [Acidobacteriota bacterium]